MGNSPSGIPNPEIGYEEALQRVTANTSLNQERLNQIFKKHATGLMSKKIRKGRDFEEAVKEVGLLNNVPSIARSPFQTKSGQLMTLDLEEDAVRESVVNMLWEIFDIDDDGSVELEEFVIGVTLILEGSLEEKTKVLFRVYDANGNGEISRKELRKALKRAMRTGRRIMELSKSRLVKKIGSKETRHALRCSAEMSSDETINKMVKEIFKEADTDGSKTISLDEFLEYSRSHPEILLMIFRVTGDALPI